MNLTNRFIFFLLSCSLLASCNGDKRQISTVPANSTTHEIILDSKVQIIESNKVFDQFELKQGTSNVFFHEKVGEAYLGDDQYDVKYWEVLVFEFDPTIESFEYQNEDLAKLNCYYLWRAAAKSLIKESIPVKNGLIKGERLTDGRWQLKINIDPKYKVNESSRKINIDVEVNTVPNKT